MRPGIFIPLLQSKRYEVYTRFLVSNLPATGYGYTNYSALNGKDMLLDAAWGEAIDDSVGHGTFQLFREKKGTINISPLMNTRTGKPWPYMSLKLETSVVPKGSGGPGDWMEVFKGLAMNVDIAADEKSLSITGVMGGDLVRRILWPQTGGADLGKTSLAFGTDGGERLDLVMQDIIDYLYPFGTDDDNLFAPDTPNFYVRKYPQELGPAVEILQTLANMIGWDFRYRYDYPGVLRPTLFKVDRDTSIPDLYVQPNEYVKLHGFNIDGSSIRTLVELYDSERNLYYKYSDVHDYGTIPMRLVEDKTFGIDTADEANDLLDAVVSDLEEPPATGQFEHFYNPLVQLNDIHKYIADGIHFSEDQQLAVSAYDHHINVDTQRTVVGTRGKPAAAFRRWLEGKPKMIFGELIDPFGTAPEGAEWYKLVSKDFPA